jgi:hypothetical protein
MIKRSSAPGKLVHLLPSGAGLKLEQHQLPLDSTQDATKTAIFIRPPGRQKLGTVVQLFAMVLRPAGVQDSARRFNAGEYPMKEFALKGRKIDGRLSGRIQFRIIRLSGVRAGRVVVDGEIPGVETPG